jgi:predicted dehydrogenase
MNERMAMVGAGYWAQFQWKAGVTPARRWWPCATAAPRGQRRWPALRRAAVLHDLAQMLDNEQPTLVDVVLPPEVQEARRARGAGTRHPDHLPEALRR